MTIEEIKQSKKVTKADIKFLEEYIYDINKNITFENVFSEENVTARGYLAGLIKFVFDLSACNERYGLLTITFKDALSTVHEKLTPKNWVSKFDRARYLVLKLDEDIYRKLID